jgi:nucleoside-triphosphatase THEP1
MDSVLVITGKHGRGKTALCQRMLARLAQSGFAGGGVISPGVYEAGLQIGKCVQCVRTGESRPLARARREPGASAGGYELEEAGLAWGSGVIMDSLATSGLLFIDEVGPAELLDAKGWRMCLDRALVLDRPLVLTVRPSLLGTLLALTRSRGLAVLEAGTADLDTLAARATRFLGVDHGYCE